MQIESGPFVEFLNEVLEPLNQFFTELPEEYNAKRISAGYVARIAINGHRQLTP